MRSDTPLRVQTLTGQIKQADADVAETELLLHRAAHQLERATQDHEAAKQRALDLRAERNRLAEETADAIRRAGETEQYAESAYSSTTEHDGAETPAAGEEVIQSPQGEGATDWPSAYGSLQEQASQQNGAAP